MALFVRTLRFIQHSDKSRVRGQGFPPLISSPHKHDPLSNLHFKSASVRSYTVSTEYTVVPQDGSNQALETGELNG